MNQNMWREYSTDDDLRELEAEYGESTTLLTKRVGVALSEVQFLRLREEAARRGMTVSNFLRARVTKERLPPIVISIASRTAWARLEALIMRLDQLELQLTDECHGESVIETHQSMLSTLNEVRSAVRELRSELLPTK